MNAGSNIPLDCNGNNVLIAGIEGLNSLEIFGEDHAGNIGSQAVSFTVDTISPVVDITSPDNSNVFHIRLGSLTVNYDITETGSGLDACWYTVNDGNSVDIDCNGNSFRFKPQTTVNFIEVFAQDYAGNIGTDSETVIW